MDGQQRLTTLSILLYFLGDQEQGLLREKYNQLSNDAIVTNFEILSKRISELSKDEQGKYKEYLLEHCQIHKRRKTIISILHDYYNKNTTKILWFLSGYEYRDKWTDYEVKLRELEQEKENKIIEFHSGQIESYYTDEYEILYEYKYKASLLCSEYPVSIDN